MHGFQVKSLIYMISLCFLKWIHGRNYCYSVWIPLDLWSTGIKSGLFLPVTDSLLHIYLDVGNTWMKFHTFPEFGGNECVNIYITDLIVQDMKKVAKSRPNEDWPVFLANWVFSERWRNRRLHNTIRKGNKQPDKENAECNFLLIYYDCRLNLSWACGHLLAVYL